MKYILPIILTFLMNLPNCGMVFSGEMSTMEHHIHIEEAQSMDMDGDHIGQAVVSHIEDGSYDCCPNASKGILERNIASPFSLENISTNILPVYSFSQVEFTVNIRKYHICIYRSDSPPDPSEYISLIGTSVKNLN